MEGDLRLCFVLREDPLLIPGYFSDVLENLGDGFETVAVAPVTGSEFASFWELVREGSRMFGLKAFLKIFCMGVLFNLMDSLDYGGGVMKRRYSVQKAARNHGVDIWWTDDINGEDFITAVKDHDIDVIVSSSPVIFDPELLDAPSIGCINLHHSYLPRNKGPYPVYQVIARGREKSGVSIHWMEEAVDEGPVLEREEFDIEPGDTRLSIFMRGYKNGAGLTVSALERIQAGERGGIKNEGGRYYPPPDPATIKRFRDSDVPAARLSDIRKLINW